MCIVTISRGSFGGAKAVAEGVADELGVSCVSREIIIEAAESAGITERALNEVLDRPPSFFERASRERDTYLVFVQTALHQHAAEGTFVYHGHDGHLLLSELPNVLRVRVVAPLEARVKSVRKRLDLDDKQARRHIAKMDGYRAKWTRFLYGVDWADPLHYDLVVNLEKIEVAEAVAMIADLARSDRFAWTEALRSRAAELALSTRVGAAVAQVSESRGGDLEIAVEGRTVILRGHTRYDEIRRAITDAAEAVEGVEQVRCEIEIPSDVFRD